MNGNFSNYLQFLYCWTADDIRNLAKLRNGECKKSPEFVTSINRQAYVWQIEIYPNGLSEEDKGYLSVFLVPVSGVRFPIRGNYVMSLINQKYQETRVEESEETDFKRDKGIGESKYVAFNVAGLEADGILWNDSLTFQFRLNIHEKAFRSEDTISVDSRVPSPKIANHVTRLFDGIENEKANKDYDVLIISSDKRKFYCQRKIVGEASDVLASLFEKNKLDAEESNGIPEIIVSEDDSTENKGKEGEDSVTLYEADFEDINGTTILETLRYIYCGKANLKADGLNLDEMLNLSQEWDLKGLISQCEEELISSQFTAQNACKIFMVSDQLKMLKAKKLAIRTILANMKEVTKTSEWATLARQPKMITQIFQSGPVHSASFTGLTGTKFPNESETKFPNESELLTAPQRVRNPRSRRIRAQRQTELPAVHKKPDTPTYSTANQWRSIVRQLQHM